MKILNGRHKHKHTVTNLCTKNSRKNKGRKSKNNLNKSSTQFSFFAGQNCSEERLKWRNQLSQSSTAEGKEQALVFITMPVRQHNTPKATATDKQSFFTDTDDNCCPFVRQQQHQFIQTNQGKRRRKMKEGFNLFLAKNNKK